MKRAWTVAGVLLLGAIGCAVAPARDRVDVVDALRERTGSGPAARTDDPLPEGVSLDDGLTQDESVALALWNNPRFQADLAQLGLARADLLQAGLLTNPVLSLLFPVGPKQLEGSVGWPLADLWRRRRRVALAQVDLERVAESLVQSGLDLTLDVKLAFADLLLTRDNAGIAEEAARLHDELTRIREAQFEAGDISALDLAADRSRAQEARLAASQSVHDVTAARARLLSLVGLAAEAPDVAPVEAPSREAGRLEIEQLIDRALAARPDLRAAELAVEAAGRRAGLARSEYLSISALVDANAKGEDGFEIGPGLGIGLPVFDRGQATRARAAAELERATYAYADVRNSVVTRVRESHALFAQAGGALDATRSAISPLRRGALELTEQAYASGEVAYLDVVRSRLTVLQSRADEARLSATLRRARARLENAMGSDLQRTVAARNQGVHP